MYTQLVIATLSMYSLPTLSGARDPHEFRTLLARLVGLCLVVGIAAAGVLFLMRRPLIHLVFTPAFAAVADLWPWQLIGDVFLLAGWPLRSALTAQRRMLPYMVVEAGLGLGLVAVTHAFVSRHGAAAGNMAYAVVFGTAFAVLLLLHLPTWRPQPAGALARSG
jgi:O-antigen/teichoic acid export membrane protein